MKHHLVFSLLTSVAIFGKVGQIAFLPSWLDAADCISSGTRMSNNQLIGRSFYGVLLMSSLVEFLALTFVFFAFTNPRTHHKIGGRFFMAAFFGTISSFFTFYLSNSTRVSPVTQAMLINLYAFVTLIIRLLWPKIVPPTPRIVCSLLIATGVAIYLIPYYFLKLAKINYGYKGETHSFPTNQQSFLFVLLYFLLSVVPGALMNVCVERLFKEGENCILTEEYITPNEAIYIKQQKEMGRVFPPIFYIKPPDFYYFGFIIALVKLIAVISLFWIEFLPTFGHSRTLKEFVTTLKTTMDCTIGKAEHNNKVFGFAFGYIISYLVSFMSSTNLNRKGGGSTFLALTMSLASPFAVLFWWLLSTGPFLWFPQWNHSDWLVIVAFLIILPSIIVYYHCGPELLYTWLERRVCCLSLTIYKPRYVVMSVTPRILDTN